MNSICAECGGGCCSFRLGTVGYCTLEDGQRYDSFFIEDAPVENLVKDDGEPMDAEWFVWVPDDREDRLRNVLFSCRHLEDGLCSVYEDRPAMCRSFECDALDDDEDVSFEEWSEDNLHGGGFWEKRGELTEVTGRVNEIIERRVS